MVRNRRSPQRGATFYNPNIAILYVWYDALARAYPGWTLSELKTMPARERKYWISLITWRAERRSL